MTAPTTPHSWPTASPQGLAATRSAIDGEVLAGRWPGDLLALLRRLEREGRR